MKIPLVGLILDNRKLQLYECLILTKIIATSKRFEKLGWTELINWIARCE